MIYHPRFVVQLPWPLPVHVQVENPPLRCSSISGWHLRHKNGRRPPVAWSRGPALNSYCRLGHMVDGQVAALSTRLPWIEV
jgi:hypothetical protein